MPFLVIPNEVSQNTATVWVAVINENFDPAVTVLEYGSNSLPLNAGWSVFATANGDNRISFQRVTLTNLTQRKWYPLILRVGGAEKANGSVITLPDRLPNQGDRPFTVMLGSCYFGRDDKAGAVGQTYLQLPNDAKPEIKLLCGDQVYLDNPFQDFIIPRGHDWLENRSFKTYLDNWTQSTFEGAGGFGQMLKHEANFFTSDDHEFWNNAPDAGINVPFFAVGQKKRDKWWKTARELYQIFQTSPNSPDTFGALDTRMPPIKFKVDPLSFCIADTRFNRGPVNGGAGILMIDEDFQEIEKWAADLKGPGVLVVGQPIFDEPGTRIGKIKDCGLPDFAGQFERLNNCLRRTEHTIVVLTGDVHYGRVSVATLRSDMGTKLYEVISSPLQVVAGAPGKYHDAPQVFGSVKSDPDFSLKRNHFLTLDFMSPSPQRASMLVRFWPILQNGMPLQSQTIAKQIELF